MGVKPDLQIDGWCLQDAEVRHQRSPTNFPIPSLAARQNLAPGDLAKLLFQIAVGDDEEAETVERMWVIVRERTPDGYLGVLDNDPSSIAKNDEFWSGAELPFEARHIIEVRAGDTESMKLALAAPQIPWRSRLH